MNAYRAYMIVTRFGVVYLLVAIVWPLIEIVLHMDNENNFAMMNLYVINLTISGCAVILIGRANFALKKGSTVRGHSGKVAGSAVVCTLIYLLTNAVSGFLTFQIYPGEVIMFFASIAIGEEFYYRILFVVAALTMLNAKRLYIGIAFLVVMCMFMIYGGFLTDIIEKTIYIDIVTVIFLAYNYLVPHRDPKFGNVPLKAMFLDARIIVVTILAGTVFSLAHWIVYFETKPSMLIATFINGSASAFLFMYTKDITVSITAHVVNNVASMKALIINSTVDTTSMFNSNLMMEYVWEYV